MAEHLMLKAAPYSLGRPEQAAVLEAIQEVCSVRQWHLLAAHLRITHVHLVAAGECKPEIMLNTFKAYASRRLNLLDGRKRPHWTRHGSTRYLWGPKVIAAACDYVLFQQGEPMTVFPRAPHPK